MSMPDIIYAHPSVRDDYTWGAWLTVDECCTKYHSDAKYKALEARIKELEDMLLGDADNPQARIDK